MPLTELVVLVDDHNHVLGTAPKATVHGRTTPLHRGFSLFVFNARGDVLLQQRALHKLTWPGAWSNSCCGHPALEENAVAAASRRARYELGLALINAVEIAPYRYRFTKNGIEENEICPLVAATTLDVARINPEEVAATRWVNWQAFCQEITRHPGRYSDWCEEEVGVLARTPAFQAWLRRHTGRPAARTTPAE